MDGLRADELMRADAERVLGWMAANPARMADPALAAARRVAVDIEPLLAIRDALRVQVEQLAEAARHRAEHRAELQAEYSMVREKLTSTFAAAVPSVPTGCVTGAEEMDIPRVAPGPGPGSRCSSDRDAALQRVEQLCNQADEEGRDKPPYVTPYWTELVRAALAGGDDRG